MYRTGSVVGINLVNGSDPSRNDINIVGRQRRIIPNGCDNIVNFQNIGTIDFENSDELCQMNLNYCKQDSVMSSSYLMGQGNFPISNGNDPRVFKTPDMVRRQERYMTTVPNINNQNKIMANNEITHNGIISNMRNESADNDDGDDGGSSYMMQRKFLTTTGNNNSGSEVESLNEGTINDHGFASTPPPPPSFLGHNQSSNKQMNIHQQQENGKISDQYFLWIVTPVAASISLAVVVAALAGPQWLYTEEKLPNSNYNGTANFNVQDDGAFITKYTKSSLWILCSTLQGFDSYHCIKIDYFPKEEYRPDHDSTLAIPYTVTRSSPFFLVSGIFLLISFFVFLIGICTHQNSLYYFTSGILFIVSGLLMFIGLIVYISIFKAEVGSKLRPKSTLQPPLFKYSYGQSFFLYVFGFISTEFVGVLNIFLFISLQQVGHHKTIPCFTFLNGQENMKNMTTDSRRSENRRKYLCNFDENPINKFMCRKHSIPSNYFFEHRYYFEKPEKCGMHRSQNLAKSLNELYRQEAHQQTPNYSSFDIPPEFPLTRSVSTSTEIFSKSRFNNSQYQLATNNYSNHQQQQQQQQQNHQQSTIERKNKKNQTNDSKESVNMDICGLSRGILTKGKKSKDDLFNEFCKKAGMRPKPKDIYYIEDDNNDQDDDNIFIVDNNDALISTNKSRRNSFREPRKRNSMSSLRQKDKIYPKNFFDLEQRSFGGSQELWNNDVNNYFTKNELRNENNGLYQSRTLPRCFLKRNFDSGDIIEGGRRSDFDGMMWNSNSRDVLHKSFDDINLMKTTTGTISQPTATINNNIFLQGRKTSNNLPIQWPTAIPTSPSSYSVKSAFRYNNSNGSNGDYKTIPKFTRGYAFDDRRSITGNIFESFDLDEIERERRKSHASLLGITSKTTAAVPTITGGAETVASATSHNGGGCYDMLNGTAV